MFAIKINQTYFSYHMFPNRSTQMSFWIFCHLMGLEPSSLVLIPELVSSLALQHVSSHSKELWDHCHWVLERKPETEDNGALSYHFFNLTKGREEYASGNCFVIFFPLCIEKVLLSPLLIFLTREQHLTLPLCKDKCIPHPENILQYCSPVIMVNYGWESHLILTIPL